MQNSILLSISLSIRCLEFQHEILRAYQSLDPLECQLWMIRMDEDVHLPRTHVMSIHLAEISDASDELVLQLDQRIVILQRRSRELQHKLILVSASHDISDVSSDCATPAPTQGKYTEPR